MQVHCCSDAEACYHPTPAERSVIELVARGKSTTEIAYRLGIKPQTVKNRLSRIYEQFECGDRITMVMRAARAGLVDLESVVREA